MARGGAVRDDCGARLRRRRPPARAGVRRACSPRTKAGLLEFKYGILPDLGGTQRPAWSARRKPRSSSSPRARSTPRRRSASGRPNASSRTLSSSPLFASSPPPSPRSRRSPSRVPSERSTWPAPSRRATAAHRSRGPGCLPPLGRHEGSDRRARRAAGAELPAPLAGVMDASSSGPTVRCRTVAQGQARPQALKRQMAAPRSSDTVAAATATRPRPRSMLDARCAPSAHGTEGRGERADRRHWSITAGGAGRAAAARSAACVDQRAGTAAGALKKVHARRRTSGPQLDMHLGARGHGRRARDRARPHRGAVPDHVAARERARIPEVGATENLLTAAVLAKGQTGARQRRASRRSATWRPSSTAGRGSGRGRRRSRSKGSRA